MAGQLSIVAGAALVGAWFCAAAGAAPVFESVGSAGEASFSDRPTPGAVELGLPPAQTYDAPRLTRAVFEASEVSEQTAAEYKELKILSPTPGETFRNNGGKVPLRIALTPGLRAEDQIKLFLDGSEVPGAHTSMTLDNVDRGEHTVYAEVLDKQGKPVARSDAVHFYLHRTSIPKLFRAAPRRRNPGLVPPSAPSR